jgi:hypothetical protein
LPHDADGVRVTAQGNAGDGCAKCQCGTLSPPLPSTKHRKAWHREHKGEHAVLYDRNAAPPRDGLADDEVWAWNLDAREWQITSIPLHVDGNAGGSPSPVEDAIEAGA